MTDYMKLAQDVVAKAASQGVDAEAIVTNEVETEIKVDRGEIEQLSQSGSLGLGVRVIKNGQTGYAYTSDFSENSIDDTVKAAIELADVVTADEHRQLPDPEPIPDDDLRIFDSEFEKVSTEQKIEFVKAVEKAALEFDERVIMTTMCSYFDAVAHVYLANSKGFAGSYSRTVAGSFLMAIAKDDSGMMNAMNFGVSNFFNELDPSGIGAGAGKNAVDLLGGKPVETQTCTVVFDPLVAGEILGYLSMALTAEAMQRGRSFLVNKMGQEVASDRVTLLDNGRMLGGIASAPFDGEGVPTSATRLIDEGVLQNVIYDSYTASRDGVKSTGNAGRGGHRSLPSLGPTNFYLQPGPTSPDELIAGVENGLYVTRIMQTGGVNPVTGDCSMGANGLWIKDGKLAQSVSGVTVATTLNEFLQNISEVANDLRIMPFFGAIGAPTIRVDNVTVGGAE
jgi:PmbA protein